MRRSVRRPLRIFTCGVALCASAADADDSIKGTGQYDIGPPNLYVGTTAPGTLILSSAGLDRDPGTVFVGTGVGGDGTLTLTNGTSMQAEHLRVGGQGKGKLVMFDGTRIASTGGTAHFDGAPGLPTEVLIAGARLTDFLELTFGGQGPASFLVAGTNAQLFPAGTLTVWLFGTGQFSGGAYARPSDLNVFGGELRVTGDGTLCEPGRVKITHPAKLDIEDGATLRVQGFGASSQIQLNGGRLRIARTEVSVPAPTASASSLFRCGGAGTLIVSGSGASLTLEGGAGFLGAGCQLPVSETRFVSVSGGGVINAGNLSADIPTGTFSPPLTIEVRDAGSHLNLTGDFQFGVADFNKWETRIANRGELTANSIELAVGNSAEARLLLSNQARVTTNNVKIGVPTAEEPGDMGTAGLVAVCGGSTLDVGGGTVEVGRWGTLKGRGSVVASVINDGVVQAGCSPGILNITGDYEDTPDARLMLPLHGTNKASATGLMVDGSATVQGSVEIELLQSFPLDANVAQSVVAAAGGATFSPGATVMVTGLTGGLITSVETGPTGVLFTATSEPGRADFNDDGVTDLGDVPEFLNCLYGPEEIASKPGFCETDIDGDRDIDLRDFSGLTLSFGEVTP